MILSWIFPLINHPKLLQSLAYILAVVILVGTLCEQHTDSNRDISSLPFQIETDIYLSKIADAGVHKLENEGGILYFFTCLSTFLFLLGVCMNNYKYSV